MDNLISDFQLRYPELVRTMHESTHHFSETNLNPHHLEGDVWTHTNMVCLEARNRGLSRNNQIACLLHDIGKPACRKSNSETERVNFFGHEPYSAFMSIDVMRNFGLTDDEIIFNFQLIALHTEIFKLDQSQIQKRFVNNNTLLNNLMVVSECDRKGRYHSTEDRGEGKFPRADFKVTEGHTQEVIVLIGLPCSGKSTLRKEYPNHEVLSRDDLIEEHGEGSTYSEKWNNVDQKEIDKLLEKRKKDLLSSGKDVIIDMTNLSRKGRRKRLSGFPKSYKRKAVMCLASGRETQIRNYERGNAEGKIIGWSVFEKMMKSFYPPMYDEFEEIEWKLS